MPPDDERRYIEYLQQQLLTRGWESVFDPSAWNSWTDGINAEAARLHERFPHLLLGDFSSRLENLSEPETRFDLPNTRTIFQPILERVQDAATSLGVGPIRPIRIYTSTDVSATPAARPTSTDHYLFIGIGTSSFCNYWAKCLSYLAHDMVEVTGLARIESEEQLERILRQKPMSLILALRTALHYAAFGSTVGRGEVRLPLTMYPYRAQVLDAMETFIVAHEFAHFVAEEHHAEMRGVLTPTESREAEEFCDELALLICRKCGNDSENYLMFCGIGALIAFRAIRLCDLFRDVLREHHPEIPIPPSRNEESTHPTSIERIEAIKRWTLSYTAEDQREDVQKFVEEYDFILAAMESIALRQFALGTSML